ncbi:MAG: T9SS type A sorting domain-containing protein, partial [Mucilaginibacter polytrichastri]|nr:T9SS type A sorting domain-containing protein [Mucilaginibacter polytrichastri]
YPNPASDVLHFALLNTKGVTVRISDMRGRIIFRQQYQKNTGEIGISALKAGIYFIEITETAGQKSFKGKWIKL